MPNLVYRSLTPFTRTNDYVTPLSDNQQAILIKHYANFNLASWVDPRIEPIGLDPYTNHSVSFLNNALIYIITETMGDYPYPYLTEKTWKAMVNQRPFMLVGAKGSLQKLRDLGFKTFNEWWDEDYDLQDRVSDRIEMVVQQLSLMSQLSSKELGLLEKEMQAVTAHNLHQLRVLKTLDLANIKNQL